MAEDNNKGFWLVHTAKYFPNLALAIGDLFSNEKTTKEAAAFLCMSYSDVNLRAIAKIIDYEQPIVFFAQKSATVPAFYDSTEIQKLNLIKFKKDFCNLSFCELHCYCSEKRLAFQMM
ncbi:hypothetical protein T07_5569 [Trichinella nelsoni]|uniref:Uncharacterized protein n=1 Tax=Trichinella nelsoni TaxID=6336 RepID=A0A0V0S6F6_9BILA|nr:hypothetical protein T07_5569 [Trichinella nelsoni]